MAQGGHPITMRRFMLDHHEGLLGIAFFFQPVDRQIGHDICAIAVHSATTVGKDKVRVVIETLPREHGPVIKPLRSAFKMTFTVDRCLIAFALSSFGKMGWFQSNEFPLFMKPFL